MPSHAPSSRLICANLALLGGLSAPVAHAAVVSFTGGFTSFSGPVATGPGPLAAITHTEVNGQPVFPDRPFPGNEVVFTGDGFGLKDSYSLRGASGNAIPTVDFRRVFYGAPSTPNPNRITFTPSEPQNLHVGDSFSIGTFTLTNGTWFGSPTYRYPDTDIGFEVTTHSSDPRLDGHSFTGTLRFVVTGVSGPSATARQDADYFYLVERPDLGTLSVLERTDPQGHPQPLGNTGSIELDARIGSLIPVQLANATGAAFIGSPVPEPAAAGLWLGGLGLLALMRRWARASLAGLGLAALPAMATTGQPVTGEAQVTGYTLISLGTQQDYIDFRDDGPVLTPFVITRGFSNVVHGQPSNPVVGGAIGPAQLQASNQFVPANMPLNLQDRANAGAWDGKAFAYATGDGPSFSVGAGTSAWGEQSQASYSYAFKHINQGSQAELLSPISLHLDAGRLFLLPRFTGGGDTPSIPTDVFASFSYNVQIYVQDAVPYSSEFGTIQNKAFGSAGAYISMHGTSGSGYGDLYSLSFPPGLFDPSAGLIAVQNIPEQTLTFEQFDLLPGQRLSISMNMTVSVWADGVGPAPIFYAQAGDPLSLTSGSAAPNVLLQFAPVPEPAIGLLLPLGLAGLYVVRRGERPSSNQRRRAVIAVRA